MNKVLEMKEKLQKTQARTTNSFARNYFMSELNSRVIQNIQKKVSFDLNKDPKKLDNLEVEELEKVLNKTIGGLIK